MAKDWRKPGKRSYKDTADLVVRTHIRHPNLNSTQLGTKLGLHPAYIRKALSRNGMALGRSRSD